jgi:phage tail protein X
MMDAGVRVAAASTVLLGGILLAMLFRHQTVPSNPPLSPADEHLVLRKRLEPQLIKDVIPRPVPPRGESIVQAPAAPPAAGREPTCLKPINLRPSGPGEPFPALASDYPRDAASEGMEGIVARDQQSWGARATGTLMRVHKIADGDTLGSLAERYLGSADRAAEIYEANRDRLSSPQVLQIGVEIQSPPRYRPGPPPANLMPKRPLVPISGQDGAP